MLRRQVEAMASYGVTEAQIAGLIGIDANTLRKHYRNELDYGHVKANVKVAENLFQESHRRGTRGSHGFNLLAQSAVDAP